MIRLSDLQWERIRHHFPEENIAEGRPGRKPVSTRYVLEAVLWILNTGAQWHMLPQCYPNYKTVHRRFQAWCQNEVLRRVLMDIANELRERGALGATQDAIVERLKRDAFACELALGVFVTVQAQLGIEWKVGAELEEERSEVAVHRIDVVVVHHRGGLHDPGIRPAGR